LLVVGEVFNDAVNCSFFCNGQAGQARLRVAVKDKDGNRARNREPRTGGRTARTVIQDRGRASVRHAWQSEMGDRRPNSAQAGDNKENRAGNKDENRTEDKYKSRTENREENRVEDRNKDDTQRADGTRRAGDRDVARSQGVRAERCWMEQGQEMN
jgi:hypothetical protein